MFFICRIFIIYQLTIICSDALKILAYAPYIGSSHVGYIGSIADVLVEAGHDVVIGIILL
jgi:hypothetical protein